MKTQGTTAVLALIILILASLLLLSHTYDLRPYLSIMGVILVAASVSTPSGTPRNGGRKRWS
ncbi:MAG TPA: hypothetical protein PLW17_02800 [Limnochordia bacterium]|jgi:membrane-bound ClpP family serine protease|nr:hypothetical protein [Limnochordia bacterium]HPZ30364.1 hypothetical protein [Limnochordia bacterium]HXK98174.1 hypothetical protein [Limnochordia bacterium]